MQLNRPESAFDSLGVFPVMNGYEVILEVDGEDYKFVFSSKRKADLFVRECFKVDKFDHLPADNLE